ncbi:MAG TPA: hypothetical protein VFH51_12015, partial [Myxococcota bacterium]|nr:hypothetical protein [Myxococcota bacterium]
GGLLCLAPQSEAPAGFVEIDAQLGVWGVRSPPHRPRRRDAAVSLEAAPGDAPGGRMERALELASALIERTPRAAAAHLLRGTMNFEAQRFDDAVADLGRCLQLAPEHCMARYWFGAALLCSGDSRRGADELEHLRTRLGRMAPIALLEDAETSAHELSDAAQQLLARLA